MRVFITGATGFIGTHLVRRLVGTGAEIRCLVRTAGDARRLEAMGAVAAPGDVTDRDSVRRGMRGADQVIHLAGLYAFWVPDARAFRAVNTEGTRNVMECALEAGVSKVVHVSTVAVYGTPAARPFREDSPVGPVRFSEYASTKYEGDLIAWRLHAERGLPLVVLYPATVWGAGDTKASGQYVRDIVERRFPVRGLENRVLTLVHVDDVVEAIVRAAATPGNLGERYLIGRERLSVAEINRTISELAGVRLPRLRLPDPLVWLTCAANTALSRVTRRPPLWGLSLDYYRTLRAGFSFDGSKAERELGITYTPVRQAIAEAVREYMGGSPPRPRETLATGTGREMHV